MNYLFVESPLNLINAIEAVSFFNLKNYKFIVRLNEIERNNLQIKHLINLFNIDKNNIKFIKINANKKNVNDYIKTLNFYLFFLLTNKDKVFLGNFDSNFFKPILKFINSKNIILFDDGTKTLDIQDRFKNNVYTQIYDMFTMYNLESVKSQNIYKNEYSILRNIIKKNKLQIDENSILFLGSKLNEEGDISENYYLELINEISIKYKNKKIIYIPHRGEDKEKVEVISKIDNIIIKYLDYPIELYGLYENVIPFKVVSFFSTALITMKNFYTLEVEGYEFDYSSSPRENYIYNIYQYYKKEIPILDLKNDKK